MAAPTDVFIDPASGTDSPGKGAIGDPYASLQYAYDDTTFDTTNGTRFNVKAGTADVTGDTSLTLGHKTVGGPLIVQGYTSAQGDGGKGHINTGTASVQTVGYNYNHWIDMEVTSTAATATGMKITYSSHLVNCLLNCGGTIGQNSIASGNVILMTGDQNLSVNGSLFNNFIKSDTAAIALAFTGSAHVASGNIIHHRGTSYACNIGSAVKVFSNNSVYAPSASYGLWCNGPCVVFNNYFEGPTTIFEGLNGDSLVFSNHCDDFTTLVSQNDEKYETTLWPNVDIGSSPFTDGANDDFTPVSETAGFGGASIGASAEVAGGFVGAVNTIGGGAAGMLAGTDMAGGMSQ